MRRILPPLPLLIIAVAGAIIAGGIPAAAIQDTAGEKVLRIQWGGVPDTVDPQRIAYNNGVAVAGLSWEGLTRIDAEMNTVPAAAESWEFSPDGLTLTFHLRDDLVYSDGSPLTAERFRYAIERTCDPRTGAPFVTFLFAIAGCETFFTSVETEGADGAAALAEGTDNPAYTAARANLGVRAVDDQTLELRLREPAAYLPSVASMTVLFPAKQELIEAGGEEWWRDAANLVGNGPFQITSLRNETDPSSRTSFTANERYWGGRAKLDRIEYTTSSEWRDRADIEAAYERDELDIAWLVEPPDSALAPDQLFTPRAATEYLSYNLTQEPFTDKKVREAFAYAFDRESFCRDMVYDLCAPTLSWIPPGVPGYSKTDAYAFDPEKARQALAESTYGGPERLPEIT